LLINARIPAVDPPFFGRLLPGIAV